MDYLADPCVKNHFLRPFNFYSIKRNHVDVVELNIDDQGFYDQL